MERGAEFETLSLPSLSRSYPRRFAFHVAQPVRSIQPSAFQRDLRSYRKKLETFPSHLCYKSQLVMQIPTKRFLAAAAAFACIFSAVSTASAQTAVFGFND